jgi:hypothetical protein
MSKRETEQYVNEIWSEKEDNEAKERTSDTEPSKHMHLSTFFEIFLEVMACDFGDVIMPVSN